jgi:predicted transcriptional regulator
MTVQLAITLDEDQKARLDALAEARRGTAADIVLEAVSDYLAFDTSFRSAVQAGLAAVAEGDVADFEDVERELRKYAADRDAPTGA